MEFDRPRIKEMAKSIVHEAQPRPWKVFLIYYLILAAVSVVATLGVALPALLSSRVGAASVSAVSFPLATLLFQVLLALFNALMQMGARAYCLKLWRREPGSFHDLFQGFRMPGKTLALFGLEFLFTLLWTLPGMVVFTLLSGLVSAFTYDPVILTIFLFIGYIGFFAYLLNRILRYALAFYLLLDHSDWTARQALRESKTLMVGHRWTYFVLQLSFLGWGLLVLVIFYAITVISMMAGGASLLLYRNPSAYICLILLALLLSFLASAPLSLWLQAYWGSSIAGFYDWAAQPPASDPQLSQTTSWNSPQSPDPWVSPQDPGTFDGGGK